MSLLFYYKTGDILESDAEALVNTVNCEGFMGKGIAYQFKLRYPKNFKDYHRACKTGELTIGKLHYSYENGKIIVDFPTKNKWRYPSQMEYIEKGLHALVPLINDLEIQSIAIPPLGSGNGGLIWSEVKPLIESQLADTAKTVDIFIYEPSKAYSSRPVQEPKLSTSALILMEIKDNLDHFSSIRLQKTAYFMNIFSHTDYFKFDKYKYGPYSHSIEIISRSIKEFQEFHAISTEKAKVILYSRIISESVEAKYNFLLPYILQACTFANRFPSDHELECIATVCFLIQTQGVLTDEEIIRAFVNWSKEKASRFSEAEIKSATAALCNNGVIEKNILGYSISAWSS